MPNSDGTKSGGRKKGTPNKTTRQLKDMILTALDNSGGVKYLEEQAEKSPAAFMSLIAKVLPMTVAGEGEDGAIAVKVIERKIVKS